MPIVAVRRREPSHQGVDRPRREAKGGRAIPPALRHTSILSGIPTESTRHWKFVATPPLQVTAQYSRDVRCVVGA